MEKTNKEMFRNLILNAMKGMSQTEFAAKCGISLSHFNRMLKDVSISTPSKLTLQKIADNSSANYDDLLKACGYIIEPDPKNSIPLLPLKDRLQINLKELHEAVSQLTKTPRLYSSLEEFFDLCNILYTTQNMKVYYSKPIEYEFTDVPFAEFYSKCYFTIENAHACGKVFFLLYYTRTISGKYLIADMKSDILSLKQTGVVKSDDKIFTEDFAYNIIPFNDGKSAKDRLFEAIFQYDMDIIKYENTLVGFGFKTPEIPYFDDFIHNHMDTIRQMPKAKEMYDEGMKNHSLPREIYQDYHTNGDEKGIGALIADILRQETGFDYEYVTAHNNGDETQSYIVIDTDLIDERNEEITDITKMYAMTLGLHEYGTYLIPYFSYTEKPQTYTI